MSCYVILCDTHGGRVSCCLTLFQNVPLHDRKCLESTARFLHYVGSPTRGISRRPEPLPEHDNYRVGGRVRAVVMPRAGYLPSQ
jgi:hypothetical protein